MKKISKHNSMKAVTANIIITQETLSKKITKIKKVNS